MLNLSRSHQAKETECISPRTTQIPLRVTQIIAQNLESPNPHTPTPKSDKNAKQSPQRYIRTARARKLPLPPTPNKGQLRVRKK